MVRFFADKFLFSQKIINRMYNVLVDDTLSYSKTIQKLVLSLDESEVFVNFSVKMCQKVAAKLLFGRGRPANQLLRDLCLFDNNVFPFLLEFCSADTLQKKGWVRVRVQTTTFFDEQIKRCELALQGSP